MFLLLLLVVSSFGSPLALANAYNWINNEVEEEELEQVETNQQLELLDSNGSKNGFILFFQLVFYTVIVIGMIYALIKFLAIRQRKMQHHQVFQNLGGTPMGPNKSLQLVKVGGKIYLLGVADQITLIKEINDVHQIEEIEKDVEEQESVLAKSFIEVFQAKLKKQEPNGSSFQSLFSTSLNQQKKRHGELEKHLYQEDTKREEGRWM